MSSIARHREQPLDKESVLFPIPKLRKSKEYAPMNIRRKQNALTTLAVLIICNRAQAQSSISSGTVHQYINSDVSSTVQILTSPHSKCQLVSLDAQSVIGDLYADDRGAVTWEISEQTGKAGDLDHAQLNCVSENNVASSYNVNLETTAQSVAPTTLLSPSHNRVMRPGLPANWDQMPVSQLVQMGFPPPPSPNKPDDRARWVKNMSRPMAGAFTQHKTGLTRNITNNLTTTNWSGTTQHPIQDWDDPNTPVYERWYYIDGSWKIPGSSATGVIGGQSSRISEWVGIGGNTLSNDGNPLHADSTNTSLQQTGTESVVSSYYNPRTNTWYFSRVDYTWLEFFNTQQIGPYHEEQTDTPASPGDEFYMAAWVGWSTGAPYLYASPLNGWYYVQNNTQGVWNEYAWDLDATFPGTGRNFSSAEWILERPDRGGYTDPVLGFANGDTYFYGGTANQYGTTWVYYPYDSNVIDLWMINASGSYLVKNTHNSSYHLVNFFWQANQ
jgi:hypothetical protein